MKKLILMLMLLPVAGMLRAQQGLTPVKLTEPDLQRGKTIMTALSERCSTRQFSEQELSLSDLSDLCWAATGINRKESGKRTNPTAMNKQEIDVYVCLEKGSYRYDVQTHTLLPVGQGDARPFAKAPVCLVIVGREDLRYAQADAGMVSQNISLFCAGVGLATVPRAQMDAEALIKALNLPEGQKPILNHPVGYFATTENK